MRNDPNQKEGSGDGDLIDGRRRALLDAVHQTSTNKSVPVQGIQSSTSRWGVRTSPSKALAGQAPDLDMSAWEFLTDPIKNFYSDLQTAAEETEGVHLDGGSKHGKVVQTSSPL